MRKTIWMHILRVAGITAALITALWGINLPYAGLYNANNNYLALASKNFLQFGVTSLHFLPTYVVAPELPAAVPYYLHHPVLMFLFALVPFALFGDANWVVHVAPFIFTVLSVVVWYAVVCELTDRSTAWWSVLFFILMPFVTFFWKLMMFEAASLTFTLSVLLFTIRYIRTGKTKYLVWLAACAFLGGATDWYGLYLLFGFLYLVVSGRTKRIGGAFVAYLTGTALGLGTYAAALIMTGQTGAFWEGYAPRGISGELTSLSFWPVRLVAMTILRSVLYGSPFLVFAAWSWIKRFLKKKTRASLLHEMGAALVIIGGISLIVLPTTVWGHSYFLYYLVPFFALILGLWFAESFRQMPVIAVLLLVLQIGWNAGMVALKTSQVSRQSWKHSFGYDIHRIVPAYSTVGVVEYPGDILQNYFRINTTPLSREDTLQWAEEATGSALRYVVITCKGECTAEEMQFVRALQRKAGGMEFRYGGNPGWLLDGSVPGEERLVPAAPVPVKPYVQPKGIISPIEWMYRYVRDQLGSTQI